jgi:cell wall-associated NlpC family hydrolase
MAQAITKKDLKRIERTDYLSIRDNLKTGDLIFCSGDYTFSKLIEGFTKSVWSHVGMIYKDENLGRVLVLESEKMYGVRLAPLSKYVKDYHGKNKPYKGQIVIAKLQPLPETQVMNNAISFGLDELTKPYDNSEIIRIALRILFQIGKRKRDKKYVCSELVYECFAKAGITFIPKDRMITPDDIWSDGRVDMKYRVL